MGCTCYVGVSWDSGSLESSASIFEVKGFNRVATFENYWMEESLITQSKCPTCGDPPCSCSAFFYVKKLGMKRTEGVFTDKHAH